MFQDMVYGWFGAVNSDYNDFIKALLQGNVKAMNNYMNRVALQGEYTIQSNRESGFGRYDVILEPRNMKQ